VCRIVALKGFETEEREGSKIWFKDVSFQLFHLDLFHVKISSLMLS